MQKRSDVPHDVPILDSDQENYDINTENSEPSGRDISSKATKSAWRTRKSVLANPKKYDQTDEERMQEALAKYEDNPYVMEIRPIRVERSDGSTYIAPIIFVKPDLTIGSLVFPGGRGGSSWSPSD